jgi:hypothetical protein
VIAFGNSVLAVDCVRITFGQQIAPAVKELQAAGCESLRAIAAGLEERGIPAARGGPPQVMWLLERAGIPFGGSAANDASVVAA